MLKDMNSNDKQELRILACKARIYALEGIFNAKSGHPGGSLSAADIYTYLYYKEMNVDPQNPDMPDRDRFVLSKGHCCPSLYAVLAMKGFFPVEEIPKLRKVGAMLQGHPDMKSTPGIDMSSGSLGQGISAACGMALAGKIDKYLIDYRNSDLEMLNSWTEWDIQKQITSDNIIINSFSDIKITFDVKGENIKPNACFDNIIAQFSVTY